MEDKQHKGLKAAKEVEQYKASDEHTDELMATHQIDMEIYRMSVKEARYLKLVKRHLGQDEASTIKEEPESKEEKGNDRATGSIPKDQTGQDCAKG